MNAAMPSLPNANPRVPPHQVAGNQPIRNPYSTTQQQQQLYAFPQQYYAYPPVMMPPNMQGQPVMRNNTGMMRNMSMQPQQRHSKNMMYSYPPQRNNNDTQSRES
eukprot:scaffold26114_cov40-Cyclotella_meneghiniana.AAC.2